MKKKIQKPEYWQDFESLCKKLWGEIWQCSEIKKNGRSGQIQNGVDISAIPNGENEYYGIQCKGKDDYLNSQLSKSEIETEIEKAKHFLPNLKKFYFATTANNDVKIEEYIRLKNIEFKSQGLFEIHLFSWEDIADLIDENKFTRDWYFKQIDYRTSYRIQFLFQNGTKELNFSPEFIRYKVIYQDLDLYNNLEFDLSFLPSLKRGYYENQLRKSLLEGIQEDSSEEIGDCQPITYNNPLNIVNPCLITLNKSALTFEVCLKNMGTEVIENYKIYLNLSGIISADTVNKNNRFMDIYKYDYDIKFHSSTEAVICPSNNNLVQNDQVIFDKICIKPFNFKSEINISWKLVSRSFSDEGILKINVDPVFDERDDIVYVKPPELRESKVFVKNKYVSQ